MDREEGTTAVAEHEETQAGTDQQPQEPTSEKIGEELAKLRTRRDRELDVVRKVGGILLDITEQEAVIEEAKGRLKNLIGQRDRLNHELHEIVLGQGDTLFDGLANKAEGPGKAEPTAADDDAWRSVPLADIGIDAKLLEKLAAKELTTIGQLADFTGAGQNKLTDIEGVGPASAEKIEAALETYWVNHPRQAKTEDQVDSVDVGNGAAVSPFDLGLNDQDITGPGVFEDLLVEAEKGNEPKVDVVMIKDGDSGKLEPYVNVGGLNPETGEVEKLTLDGKPVHRLLPLYTPDEFKDAFSDDQPHHEDDKLIGTRVKVGRKAHVVGSRQDSVLVTVSE